MLGGLRLRPGSLKLIALRVGWLLACSVPGAIVAGVEIAEGPARVPLYTTSPGPLPIVDLARLAAQQGSMVVGVLLCTALLFLLTNLVLTAAGLQLLGPGPKGLWGALRAALDHFWPFVRVALVALTAWIPIVATFHWATGVMEAKGDVAGWSGEMLLITLPAIKVLLSVLWVSLVGVWAFWTRVVLIADDRCLVRRASIIGLRILKRHPIRALGFALVAPLATTAFTGALLIFWRQASADSTVVACIAWLLALVLAAQVWHWMLHAGLRLYSLSRHADLRGVPDEPYGALAGLKKRFARSKSTDDSQP